MVGALRGAVWAAVLSAVMAWPATAQNLPPPEGEMARLIWSTLLALDHANLTGNYTVLRDLADSGFRDANDAAQLAFIFEPTRDLPLGQAVLYPPRLSETPVIGEDGLLRLTGRIPMRPRAVLFDMLFARRDAGWRIFGLSVAAEEPVPEESGGPEEGVAGQ